MEFLKSPMFFNYLIMSLYGLNALRWALEGRWGDVAYWTGALWITASVTWGMPH
jgi:hypothetical protein